jgi:hypothetical protein
MIDDAALIVLFKELALGFEEVYIVVDALNESIDVEEVLNFMQTIQDWKHPMLHLAVTSRQLPEIEASLRGLVTNKIRLHDSNMKGDIALYIDRKLGTDKRMSKWPTEIKLQIKPKLLEPECAK